MNSTHCAGLQAQLPGLHAQEATLLLAGLSSNWLVQVTHQVGFTHGMS